MPGRLAPLIQHTRILHLTPHRFSKSIYTYISGRSIRIRTRPQPRFPVCVLRWRCCFFIKLKLSRSPIWQCTHISQVAFFFHKHVSIFYLLIKCVEKKRRKQQQQHSYTSENAIYIFLAVHALMSCASVVYSFILKAHIGPDIDGLCLRFILLRSSVLFYFISFFYVHEFSYVRLRIWLFSTLIANWM